jgi:hypothetical protein
VGSNPARPANYNHQINIVMKQALVLGCSHAAGSEIFGAGTEDRANSYPMNLANLLGYQPTNMAIPGGSNDAIFRLASQHHHDYDVVIACWTGCNRTEVWDGNSWQAIAPGGRPISVENYRQQWLVHSTNELSGRLNKTKNILAVNAMCKHVINIDSFWPVLCDVDWAVPDNFWDWCNKQHYEKTEFGHFGIESHRSFAAYIAQHRPTNT